MKKTLGMLLFAALLMGTLAGCGSAATDTTTDTTGTNNAGTSSMSGEITVISREDGSGTRGAFVELFGIEEKDADGNKVDNTTQEAVIANKTDVVLTNVASDPNAIGYVSLGSLNDTVKALQINGVEATAENVKNGTYTVARPFNIATLGEPTGVAKDFIAFILSKDGQTVVSSGYIAVDESTEAFVSDGATGSITIGGSSSVSPIMEKLIEAYETVNTGAKIELQTSDSTAGMTGVQDGTFAIGMASRELKDSEKETLTGTVIALDGIAVIVNAENATTSLTSEQVKAVYTGAVINWEDI